MCIGRFGVDYNGLQLKQYVMITRVLVHSKYIGLGGLLICDVGGRGHNHCDT